MIRSMELYIGGPQGSFQYCPVEGLDYSDFTEKVHFSATALPLAVTRLGQHEVLLQLSNGIYSQVLLGENIHKSEEGKNDARDIF